MNTENINIQIKTFFGLENTLAEEVKKLGGRNVEIKNRAVTCEGDLGLLYKQNQLFLPNSAENFSADTYFQGVERRPIL